MIGVQKLKTVSNIRLAGGDRSEISLPQLKTSKVGSSIKLTETSGNVKRKSGKNEKQQEFNPDTIAAEARYSDLQAIFDAADACGLDIDEFKDAMRKTVGHKMTDDEIEILFMKVDANSDGKVDWEEYVTYNLMEYQGKALMLEMMRERPFPPETTLIQSRHREMIVSVSFYPTIQKKAGYSYIDYTKGRYVTLSKEGIMSIWNLKMKHIKTYNTIHELGDRATQPWLLDLVCMYNVGMVGLSSTDRDISVFDMQGSNFLKRYHLTGIEDCITCMSYWVNFKDLNNAILCWGDTSGSVCVIVFEQCLRGGPFGSIGGKRNAFEKISVPEVIRGFYKGVKGYRFNKIHTDWVLHVKYIYELSSFVSCCQATNNSLFLCDFEKKKTHSIFKVNKGLLCFDYCPENNILVTGGMDYMIRVWNPYVCSKPIYLLKGHSKPISHVIINSRRSQIISIDKGRSIRVYEMKDQACLQQVSGRGVKLGKVPLSAVYFNPVLQTLIIATNQLAVLQRSEEEEKVAEIRSHNKPVVAALYNKTFKFVVSACQDSVISVWDLNTGEKIIQTVNAHTREDKGVEVPVEITTMSFDGPQRRVITGARDGSVKVWNFNNGNCLQTFHTPDGLEITGVLSVQHRIFVTGWSGLVQIYIDGGKVEHRKDWKRKHKEDILCMSYLSPSIIATASYDGDVIVWSCDTGKAYCTLNASKGTKPLDESSASTQDNLREASLGDTDSSAYSETNSPSYTTFEFLVSTELAKMKEMKARRSSFLRKSMLNRVKDNVIMKDNKWSRQLNQLTNTPVQHPLLPLFESQAPSPSPVGKGSPALPRNYRREEYDEICRLYESAVECILFLERRDRESGETAIMMTSGAEGWIRAWSIHHEGGLLGQFNAAHKVGESVHTMTTDENNNFLITADSIGYIKIWDITEYCTKNTLTLTQRAKRWDYLKNNFTYTRLFYYGVLPESLTTTEETPNDIESRPPTAASLPKMTLKWPLMVNSFRGHTKMINKVEFVNEKNLLITASSDCTIRIWTLNGIYMGTFGETWKQIPKVVSNVPPSNIRIPTDLHRTGSASTLKVLNEGRSSLWTAALDAVKRLNQFQEEEEEEEEESEQESESSPISIKSPIPQEDHEKPKSATTSRLKSKKTCGSDILGKSYKKTMRHRMPPTMDKFVEINSSLSVYRCLPFSELNLDDSLTDLKFMEELKNSFYGGTLMNRMGDVRTKEKQPALVGLYNKITQRNPLPKGRSQNGRIKRVQKKVQKKPDSYFADLTLKKNQQETDMIDKLLDEGSSEKKNFI